MDAGLAGKVVLITGASGGIGSAAARAFAAEDAHLLLHFHTNRTAAEALCAEIGGRSSAIQADLRDESQTDAMFAEALATFPRIDVLVVNSGIWESEPAPLHKMTLAQWNQTIQADLTSAFLTARGFLRHLAHLPRASASIVLVGSTAALFGEADHADYAAAKAGLTHGLTYSLKNEIVRLTPRGRVNCVCPGWTATAMVEDQVDDAILRKSTATMPLAKLARAEDVAAAIVFLASDRLAGHVSGAIMPVAGGMEGRLLGLPVKHSEPRP